MYGLKRTMEYSDAPRTIGVFASRTELILIRLPIESHSTLRICAAELHASGSGMDLRNPTPSTKPYLNCPSSNTDSSKLDTSSMVRIPRLPTPIAIPPRKHGVLLQRTKQAVTIRIPLRAITSSQAIVEGYPRKIPIQLPPRRNPQLQLPRRSKPKSRAKKPQEAAKDPEDAETEELNMKLAKAICRFYMAMGAFLMLVVDEFGKAWGPRIQLDCDSCDRKNLGDDKYFNTKIWLPLWFWGSEEKQDPQRLGGPHRGDDPWS
ncbi:hypothetical protein BJ508DRAFT_305899 [Ascobolus immersus RN42]|uniref:Uncharacterized protein n=1 Tax=Ascobolus immersus RN42 TaxID=1160509 RepID=A0A3N4IDD0_ASCIM|nr:hypothetical protein BJ508DRAFT_305899 [Ascobolus immersus RN42]